MKNLGKVILLLLVVTSSAFAESVNFLDFEKGIYERAQIKAAEEGKLLFIDFYAKWCTPCKWMDETTFADPGIVKQLDEKYIAIKVDIDEMEGFELKSRFNIRYLPTMLIFNAEGKMVERIEETLSPSKMSAILSSHQLSVPSIIKHDFNTSPLDLAGKEMVAVDQEVEVEEDDMVLSQDEYRQYFASEATSYRMQMGVYQNYDGALQKVNDLNKIFLEDIVVIEDIRGERKLYKVIMGNFKSIESAKGFQQTLKDKYQLDSILY